MLPSAPRSRSAATAEIPATAQQASAPQGLGYDRNIDTYLEVGKSRTFAGALEWPGWCRGGKTPEQALQALVDYGPRYARVVRGTKLRFAPPKDVAELKVVERIGGDATTDFGAPGMAPKADGEAVAVRPPAEVHVPLETLAALPGVEARIDAEPIVSLDN